GHRTRVTASAADRDDAGESAYRHGGGRARGGPVTQLALVVPPPALHRAVRQQCTGVIGPGCDGVGAPDAAHCHRHGGTGRPRGRVGGGPIAELPVDVSPPALHRAVPPERTGVFIPSTDGNGAGESADRDRNGGGEVEGPVAALPGVARPPALHRPVPKERATQPVASSNAGRCGETTDFDRNAGVVEGPVAELPELVPPHALH